jgi:hypothetical protein
VTAFKALPGGLYDKDLTFKVEVLETSLKKIENGASDRSRGGKRDGGTVLLHCTCTLARRCPSEPYAALGALVCLACYTMKVRRIELPNEVLSASALLEE